MMWYFLRRLPYDNEDVAAIGPVDPLLGDRASIVYERDDHPFGIRAL